MDSPAIWEGYISRQETLDYNREHLFAHHQLYRHLHNDPAHRDQPNLYPLQPCCLAVMSDITAYLEMVGDMLRHRMRMRHRYSHRQNTMSGAEGSSTQQEQAELSSKAEDITEDQDIKTENSPPEPTVFKKESTPDDIKVTVDSGIEAQANDQPSPVKRQHSTGQ